MVLKVLFIVVFFIIFFGFIIISYLSSCNNCFRNKGLEVGLNKLSYWLLYIALISLLSVFFGAYLFTREAEWDWADLSDKGDLGDAIGGLTSPFIGFAGVIVTGLAFYMQYQANKLQVDIFKQQNKQTSEELIDSRTQFEKQIINQKKESKRNLFESQFYERLKLLKEEVNEICLVGMDSNFNGRQVFYELDKEIRLVYLVVRELLPTLDVKKCFVISYNIFYQGRKHFFKQLKSNSNDYDLSQKQIKKLESTFYSLYLFFKEEIEVKKKKKKSNKKIELVLNRDFKDFNNEWTKKIIDEKFSNFLKGDLLTSDYDYKRVGARYYKLFEKKYDTTLKHLPFHGMYTKLSLIFRQIYGLVKFVVNNENLKYKEKRNYLRILRSILGNYEQLQLFYNWYGDIGKQWEEVSKNSFFVDYRMIHNLPIDFLIEDIEIEKLFKKDFLYEKNKKRIDSLFEIIELFSEKKEN